MPSLILLAEKGHARTLVVRGGPITATVLRESLAAVDHQVGATVGLVQLVQSKRVISAVARLDLGRAGVQVLVADAN